MRKTSLVHIVPTGILALLLIIGTSCIHISGSSFWVPQVKYERVVELSTPTEPGLEFVAQTHNGYIVINGAEASVCDVSATITGRAPKEEDARKIAEDTQVRLIPAGDKLTLKIDKPRLKRNQSLSVNLDVILPDQSDLDLTTHNGEITITNITGEIEGTTHNGDVKVANVNGDIKMESHNGSFTCEDIAGDLALNSHNGRVHAVFAESAPPICDIKMVAHNGSLEVTPPENFSAHVTVKTHNGSINTDLPLTVVGRFGQKSINGTIGAGEGNLYLETHNGSVKIR